MRKLIAMVALFAFMLSWAQTEVRWYVGLGAGTDQAVIEPQENFVAAFNAAQNDIKLVLEIVDADNAYDILATQLAAGNPPDIVGPMGVKGRDSFPGAWLDLNDLIIANDYDLSDFDPSLVDFYAIEGQGQLGIPFAVFPSYISYNKDLFDEAGLNYPPTAYGEPYIDADGKERPWNYETLRELAIELTVDINGNIPSDADFDPNAIVQWGYGVMWTDLRGRLSLFGADTFNNNGKAEISDRWREAVQWYHNAMWVDYFYPSGPYATSEVLASGNWFESGNLAMAHTHLWYQACCLAALESSWDLAPMVAAADGSITAKLHGDTFGIAKGSKNPEAAFTVLQYMLGEGAAELAGIYGGLPARLSLQEAFFADLSANQFVGQDLNWDIAIASLSYPDNPNHEAGMPGGTEAHETVNQFAEIFENNADIDIDAELASVLADLQLVFDANQ